MGTPSSSIPAAMPANSATVVKALATTNRAMAKVVLRTPKRSRIRSARPLPVTTPIRALISLMTIRQIVTSTSSQSILKRNWAPAWA